MAFGPKLSKPLTPKPAPTDPARAAEVERRQHASGGVSVTTAGQAPIAQGSATPTYAKLVPAD